MQKIFAYIGVMVVGVVIGCLLPDSHFRYPVVMGQADTIIKYDTVRYSRFELESNRLALKIPKIDVPKLTFLDIEKIDTVYKDNVMYLAYPRENYYTKANDVEIWHSGIDSTIDSLNVVRKTEVVTKTTQDPFKRNRLSIGAEVGYFTFPYIPIYLEYSRMLHKNVEFYVRAMYDIPSASYGASVGAKLQVGW